MWLQLASAAPLGPAEIMAAGSREIFGCGQKQHAGRQLKRWRWRRKCGGGNGGAGALA